MPDFLVIGAPKAGTTALHAALARHPGLYMSPIKEPKFFLTDGPPPTKGGPGDALTYREHVWRRADYEALFDAAPPGALRGESTPLYLYDRAAMRRIRDALPAARLIVIVRDPVERAHSNWTHLWSAGLEPVGDFVRACDEEERRIAAGWASFWHYTGLGRYGEQLEYLFTLFPREQVLVLRYRLLVDEPARDPGPDLHVPRCRARPADRDTSAERHVSPRTHRGAPRGVAGPAGGQRARQLDPWPDRGHADRPARAFPAAAQPRTPATELAAAPAARAAVRGRHQAPRERPRRGLRRLGAPAGALRRHGGRQASRAGSGQERPPRLDAVLSAARSVARAIRLPWSSRSTAGARRGVAARCSGTADPRRDTASRPAARRQRR